MNLNEKYAFEALWELVSNLKIKITKTSLRKAFLEHPEATSLAGLSDVLNEFHIPNIATRLSINQLEEIPLPAIAYFDGGGGTYITLLTVNDGFVEWKHTIDGIIKESFQSFLHKWSGITLLVEANEKSRERNFEANRRKEILSNLRLPVISTGIFIITAIILINQKSIINPYVFYSFLLTKVAGVLMSGMLVGYSFDSSNIFLRKVCQLSSKTGCSPVLNSSGAKFLRWLSWAEIGLIYFTSGLLYLLIATDNALNILALLALIAVPYTGWSIYYQAFKIKRWCPLCLGVQAVLISEAIIAYKNGINLPINSLWIGIVIFLFISISWIFLSDILKKAITAEPLHIQLQRLKFSSSYIQTIFTQETFLPSFFEEMEVIKRHNSKATDTITIVLNPLCGSCREMYFLSKEIASTFSEVQVQYIMAASLNPNDDGGRIARSILSQEDKSTALKEWFKENNDVEQWIHHFPEDFGGINQAGLHLRWLGLANIQEAPKIYLNSNVIPSVYKGSEINRLLKHHLSTGFANQQ